MGRINEASMNREREQRGKRSFPFLYGNLDFIPTTPPTRGGVNYNLMSRSTAIATLRRQEPRT